MSVSAAELAFAVPDILDNILEHIYTAGLEEESLSLLIPATLVSKVWTDPAQTLLHRRLVFRKDLWRIKKWLHSIEGDGGGSDALSRFVSIAVHVESNRVIEEESEEYRLVARLMQKVRGVELLVLGLTRQTTVPSYWLLEKNIASMPKLVRSNLAAIRIMDFQPQASRDWTATFNNLTRWKGGAGSSPVRMIEVKGVANFTPYLVPQIPLPENPNSIRGSIFPFAPYLLTLSLPYLLPSCDIYNLAILGVACQSLEALNFDEVSTESASSIPILRFFPTLRVLSIGLLVGLPHAPSLHPRQFELLASAGRGDVVSELSKLYAMEEMRDLGVIIVHKAKFFYNEQRDLFIQTLHKRGGTVGFPQPVQPTPEEAREAYMFLQQAVTWKELDEAKKQIAIVQTEVEANVVETEGVVNGLQDGNLKG
ncbi:hypothetical protein JCM5350_004527 [Sporobolomyces pararoseus]